MIDSINIKILSNLTFIKVFNLVKLYFSFHLSNITKKGAIYGMPSFISVEPTNKCNLSCPECPTGQNLLNRNKGNIDINLYKKIIAELYPYLTYINLYHQGEPLLNNQLFEMIKYANSKNIFTSTSTNGQLIDDNYAKLLVESGLKRLVISIDGATQDTYSSYRVGGDLNKLILGTENIIKWKKALNSKYPYIVFQVLVLRTNEHQINDIIKLGKTLGVDKTEIKNAQINDYKHGNKLMPDNPHYSRYKKLDDNTYTIKNKLPNKCWRMWSSAVITIDGDVIPCCFDKNIQFNLGNISIDTFKSIWRSKNYDKFRRDILRSRKTIDICTNCTEGLRI